MRDNVVFGARQPFGFQLCSQLLDAGYNVLAIEHVQWQTPEQEEQWLNIGRNANLQYQEITSGNSNEFILDCEENLIIFLPLIDYLSRNDLSVQVELIQQLNVLTERIDELNRTIVMLQPGTFERNHKELVEKLQDSLSGWTTIEYFFPELGAEKMYEIVKEIKGKDNREIQYLQMKNAAAVSIVETVIEDLEREHIFE